MAVKYVPFDGARVSRRWNVVLRRARKDGVKFHLNSGHRTIRQQTAMFRQNMHLVRGRWVPRPGRPLTAFPSPLAPHIRTGRAAHALDLDNAANVAHWLRAHRLRTHLVRVTFPVPGEPWHLEIGGADLGRLWRHYR